MLAALTLGLAASTSAQTVGSPNLATLVEHVFGQAGLVVDSEARLPDGSTHSGHFNSSFHSNIGQFNTALAGQLTALPLPSPASSMTYRFDTATGTFARSTRQSFTASGPFGTMVLDDVAFNDAAFWGSNGAAGVKIRLTRDVLANVNVRFRMGSNGLTTRVAPLVGLEYGF